MAQWDGPRGILFTAHDTSADEAAEMTVELLAPDKTYRLEGQTAAQWREEMAFLTARQRQESLLEPTPEKLCIVIRHLDELSEDYHFTLKGLFDLSRRSFCCLASATAPDRIPDYLRSHFFECAKLGRPRHDHEGDKGHE